MNSSLLTLEDIADFNFNIIVKIYKLLDFVDQLRFAQTSQWLKQIFKTHIWTTSYKTLKVDTVNEEDLHGKLSSVDGPKLFNVYESNGKRICLNQKQFDEFLALYANEVSELIAWDNYFSDIRIFQNITSLKSRPAGANVEQHFKIVALNFPNLQRFEVKKYAFSWLVCSVHSKLLNIDYLFKLRYLKILSLECVGYTMQYEQFCDIIRNLNLEYLRILVTSIKVNVPEVIHVETPKFLTDLHVHLPDSQLLGWNYNIFENILRLNLSCAKILNFNDWNKFCTAATRLEIITMKSLQMPSSMDIINLPNSLKQVNIENCKNLTHQHLTQIFNLPNLLKFSSTKTNYNMRNLFNYKLPARLQSLNCEGINTFDLLTSLENDQNLEELTWYNYKKNSLWSEDNRLLFCKSLKTLNVDSGTLDSNFIMRMQNLCKLSFCYKSIFMWSDVIALLKHPGLKELHIIITDYPGTRDESSVSELVEGFTINLSVLCIPSSALEVNLNFWLDLLCHNISRLKLIVHWMRKDLLKKVVGHQKFPKRFLRTVLYDNYIVDCKTLQIKFHDKNRAGLPLLSSDNGRTLVLCNDKIE